jgi:uncharacterized protein
MPRPVVHFEIIGNDPDRLRSFFGELFDWRYERTAVSEPDGYGFIDLLTAADGSGIRGGIGGGPGYGSRALFYVGVPDVEQALERAESLGGVRTMGPQSSPTGLVVGHFTDPAGNLIGLASAG